MRVYSNYDEHVLHRTVPLAGVVSDPVRLDRRVERAGALEGRSQGTEVVVHRLPGRQYARDP